MFTCDNGRCIYRSLVCDFIDDCGDASDEYCSKWLNTLKIDNLSKTYLLWLTCEAYVKSINLNTFNGTSSHSLTEKSLMKPKEGP